MRICVSWRPFKMIEVLPMSTHPSRRSMARWLTIAAVLACLGVVASEAAVRAWLALRPPGQTTPVYDWTGGEGANDRSGDEAFLFAVRTFQPDHARWVELAPSPGVSVQVQIMGWDNAEDALRIAIKGHAPEICNVAAGFTFVGREQPRVWEGGQRVDFDATAFRSPTGQTVYVFRNAWMAGQGNLSLESALSRSERLRGSIRRRAGAARVMQVGVFGAGSSDEAWGICERNVLGECVWK